MKNHQKKKEVVCEDCLAYYTEGYNHVCPPWLKFLVTEDKKRKARDVSPK